MSIPCAYTQEDKDRIHSIQSTVEQMKDNQHDCMTNLRHNKDTMEHILHSVDGHLSRLGMNSDRITSRIDSVLSQGLLPVSILKWIVISFIVMAASFALITLFFIFGWDNLNQLLHIGSDKLLPGG